MLPDGSDGFPCGAYREYLMQPDQGSPGMKILVDLKTSERKPSRNSFLTGGGSRRFH
jgi:hypothetical protein